MTNSKKKFDKTVLVTGASSGIGWDTVRLLTENSHLVIATVRQSSDAEKLKKSFGESVIPLIVDVIDFAEVDQLPKILKERYSIKRIDTLVNNAGIALAGPFLNQDFEEIQSTLSTNVLGVMKITQTLLPLLGAFPGSKNPGKIINISSISGLSAAPFLSVYAASKHAIEGFSQGLRKELMLFGIQVSVIGPGSIKTPIWSKGFQIGVKKYAKSPFAKAFQKFADIAANEEKNALPVEEISNLILQIIENDQPAYRYAPIPRKLVNWYIPNLIPNRMFDSLTAKFLGLKPNR